MSKAEARTHFFISIVVQKFIYRVRVIDRGGGGGGRSVDEMTNYDTDKKESVFKDLII